MVKKKRPFHKLTVKIFEKGITQADLARSFGVSQTSVTRRFNGTIPWDLDWVYFVCDMLGIPYIEIPLYFPPKIVKGSST